MDAKTRTLLGELKGFSSKRDVERVKVIHRAALQSGLESNKYVANTLVSGYARCGRMAEAHTVFEQMGNIRSVVSWNCLILGYAENGEGQIGLELFSRMLQQGFAPESRTYVAVFKACTVVAATDDVDDRAQNFRCLERAKDIHEQARRSGCGSQIHVASTLVDMYANFGEIEEARRVFNVMVERNVVCWNSMIFGYAENGEGQMALEMLARMTCEGCVPDVRSFLAALKACTVMAAEEGVAEKEHNLERAMAIHARIGCDHDVFLASMLIDLYSRCGKLMEARRVFDNLGSRNNQVSWNALMFGYVENGEARTVLELFSRMQAQGCIPDALNYVSPLKACALMVDLEAGKLIHADIRKRGFETDRMVNNSLVDFYSKCNCMKEAQQVFDTMKSKGVVAYSTLMAGYSRHGESARVLELFQSMLDAKLQPDGVAFLALLSSCSHAGLVHKAHEYFKDMVSKFGIEPGIEHYGCMIDILGRANELQAALSMVENMPFQPDHIIWTIILEACRKWKNVEVGRVAFESLLKLDDRDPVPYILMEEIYKSRGGSLFTDILCLQGA